MTVEESLAAALRLAGVPVVVPDADRSDAPLYAAYLIDRIPVAYADDDATMYRLLIAVTLYAPVGMDTRILCARVRRALHDAGFGWPECEDVTAESRGSGRVKQASRFECEADASLDAPL